MFKIIRNVCKMNNGKFSTSSYDKIFRELNSKSNKQFLEMEDNNNESDYTNNSSVDFSDPGYLSYYNSENSKEKELQ